MQSRARRCDRGPAPPTHAQPIHPASRMQVFDSAAGLAEAACGAALACGAGADAAAAAGLLARAADALAAHDPTGDGGGGGAAADSAWSDEALERMQRHKAAAHSLEQARRPADPLCRAARVVACTWQRLVPGAWSSIRAARPLQVHLAALCAPLCQYAPCRMLRTCKRMADMAALEASGSASSVLRLDCHLMMLLGGSIAGAGAGRRGRRRAAHGPGAADHARGAAGRRAGRGAGARAHAAGAAGARVAAAQRRAVRRATKRCPP
jgi:hypothetical protein